MLINTIVCVYAQLVVRVNIWVKFSLAETFHLHEKFFFIQALKNIIVEKSRGGEPACAHLFIQSPCAPLLL